MPDDGITLGEVYRIAKDAAQKYDSLQEKYVVRREYDKDQQNTDRKILDVVTDLAKTDAAVGVIQKEQVALEKERQSQAAARRWQLFLLFAGPVATAIVTILIFQGQTQ